MALEAARETIRPVHRCTLRAPVARLGIAFAVGVGGCGRATRTSKPASVSKEAVTSSLARIPNALTRGQLLVQPRHGGYGSGGSR